jgi:dienelactone hydrolase
LIIVRRIAGRASLFKGEEANMIHCLAHGTQPVRAAAKTIVFVLKLLPMLPSRALDWITPSPIVKRVRYPTCAGQVEGDLYRPASDGPHPGVVVCLGVVPFGVDHPQVPRLGAALARSGFAALLYWSPALRDLRLDPEDSRSLALAYQWLITQPFVDASRSGFIGTCVGGSFALMAAADPTIRDRVAFVAAFAPYASMRTLAQDIVSGTRLCGATRVAWPVDPLTRQVFVHSMTALLEPSEADVVRTACTKPQDDSDYPLSEDGRAVYRLLTRLDVSEAEAALNQLPSALQAHLEAMSPLHYLPEIHAPLLVFCHDRDDLVIPVDESRRLWAALKGRAGVQYTEFAMFEHADPTKRKLPLLRLVQELRKFYHYVYPVFRQAVAE